MIEAVLDNLRTYWMVHALLGAYTILLVRHALHGSRATKGLADYYVGGRSMGPIVIGLSFFATYSSTNSFVGFSGQAYDWGISWFLLIPFIVGMQFLAWVVVAPKLRELTEKLDSLTVPDFIGFRFDSTPARVLAAIIVVFASLFYMTAVFKGIGNLLEAFLDIPYKTAIIIVFFIVMAYTIVGGFISVVRTDAVQGVLMIGAAVILFHGVFTVGRADRRCLGRAQGGLRDRLLVRVGWGRGDPRRVWASCLPEPASSLVEPRQLSRVLMHWRVVRLCGPASVVSTLAFTFVYALLTPVGLYARRVLGNGLGRHGPGGAGTSDRARCVCPRRCRLLCWSPWWLRPCLRSTLYCW